jgi:hypothetical protein
VARTLLFVLALLLAALLAGLFLLVQPFVTPRPWQAPEASAEQLEADVRRLAVDFHPRSADHPENLAKAADHIRGVFREAGAKVSLQPVGVQGHRYVNVIGHFGPEAGPLLVIGAHYDTHVGTPGADDNASGVAGLLELARLLARTPPAGPVQLVAYPLEEQPYFRTGDMGSARHARALRAAGREVRLMVSLEMIGSFSEEPGSQRYPLAGLSLLYPQQGDFIALVGRFGDFGAMRRMKAAMAGASPLPVRSINAPPALVQGIDWSDHLNYWNEGYPAVMVTDTAFLRNAQYHQPGDTPDKLDYRRMAQVVQGLLAFARQAP